MSTSEALTKTRVPLPVAAVIAEELLRRLGPFCERLEIAGSIRRRKPTVGDIELLAVPRHQFVPVPDLFGSGIVTAHNLLDGYIATGLQRGEFQHRLDKNGRPAVGPRFKRLVFDGVALDLFSVLSPAQWGVLQVIRTGSAAFSHRLVTPRLEGGWLPTGHHVKDGAIWDGATVLEMPDEAAVFALLEAPLLAPERRTDTVQLVR